VGVDAAKAVAYVQHPKNRETPLQAKELLRFKELVQATISGVGKKRGWVAAQKMLRIKINPSRRKLKLMDVLIRVLHECAATGLHWSTQRPAASLTVMNHQ
jgi:hypothetical protein